MKEAIGNVFSILKGHKAPLVFNKPVDGAYRYIQIEDLRPCSEWRYAKDDNGVLASTGDILLTWDGANAGTVGWGLEGYAGSTIAILKPISDKVYTSFLGYFLHSRFDELQANCSGATIPHINRNYLERLEVDCPPLPEQKRIATILEKADRLRRIRRYARELSDTYLQSVFLEMFGDPVKNPMGWEVVTLKKIGKLDRGRSKHRPRNAPELYGGAYPFIQTGDVANATGYIRKFSQTYSDIGLKQSKLWPSGTMCITIAANIARTAVITFDACFPDSIVGFTPNERTNVEFIQNWFSFMQKNLEDIAPESAQKNINLEILRKLEVSLPPKPMQERFAKIVQRFERLRAQQREAERQAEHLFQTLLHKAFKGELG